MAEAFFFSFNSSKGIFSRSSFQKRCKRILHLHRGGVKDEEQEQETEQQQQQQQQEQQQQEEGMILHSQGKSDIEHSFLSRSAQICTQSPQGYYLQGTKRTRVYSSGSNKDGFLTRRRRQGGLWVIKKGKSQKNCFFFFFFSRQKFFSILSSSSFFFLLLLRLSVENQQDVEPQFVILDGRQSCWLGLASPFY